MVERPWLGVILLLCASLAASKGITSRLIDVTDRLAEVEDVLSLLKSIDDILQFNQSSFQNNPGEGAQESAEVRAQEIVDKMTFQEKFKLIAGEYFSHAAGETSPIPRLKIPGKHRMIRTLDVTKPSSKK